MGGGGYLLIWEIAEAKNDIRFFLLNWHFGNDNRNDRKKYNIKKTATLITTKTKTTMTKTTTPFFYIVAITFVRALSQHSIALRLL